MTIRFIEANSVPSVINSFSRVGLETVVPVSASKLVMSDDNCPKRFENSSASSERPIIKPTRKRSKDSLILQDVYDRESMQNATFGDDRGSELKAPKSTRLQRIINSDSSSSHWSSYVSYRSSQSSSQGHLMERHIRPTKNVQPQSKTNAPQMPRRKASFVRRTLWSYRRPTSIGSEVSTAASFVIKGRCA